MGTTIEHPTDAHLKKVWDMLDKMHVGQMIVIKQVAPNVPELFIKCCCMWIDCYHEAEFNSDFTVIKKISFGI